MPQRKKKYQQYRQDNKKQRLPEPMWEMVLCDLKHLFKLNRLASIFSEWLPLAKAKGIIPQVDSLATFSGPKRWMNYKFDELVYHSEVQ